MTSCALMPENTNFDQIALGLAMTSLNNGGRLNDDDVTRIAEQLRLVWNARGAADLAAIDALDRVDLDTPLAEMLTSSQDAIRGLDR